MICSSALRVLPAAGSTLRLALTGQPASCMPPLRDMPPAQPASSATQPSHTANWPIPAVFADIER